ncbi:MAG: hypothetical protein ACREVE_09205 [Gammaproteobacteria bacterium]
MADNILYKLFICPQEGSELALPRGRIFDTREVAFFDVFCGMSDKFI